MLTSLQIKAVYSIKQQRNLLNERVLYEEKDKGKIYEESFEQKKVLSEQDLLKLHMSKLMNSIILNRVHI